MRTLAAVIAALGVWACSNDNGPARCVFDTDCGAGRVCDTGTCKAASSTRTVGEACTVDGACSVGSVCATGMPDGLCTYSCAGDTCPSGAVCADLRASGGGILCAKACAAPADCRSGYTCCLGLGACVPAASCPPQGRASSADLGKACTAGACTAVAGEICVGDPNPEFPGGLCTAACNPNDQTTCPANGKCVSTSTGSFCFPSCTAATPDCVPFGQLSACVAGACRSSGASPACTPPGTPTVVVGPAVTTPQPTTACDPTRAAPVGTPAWPALATQSFGAKVVGGAPVQFNVPAGTGSISILSQGSNVQRQNVTLNGSQLIPNSVVPTLVTNPSNAVLFDDLPTPPADGSGVPVFYGGFSPFTGMMTLPNTSFSLEHTALQGGFDPGTWKFTVNDFALECTQVTNCTPKTQPSDTYDVRVLLKPGIPAATGTVNVAFYLVGGLNTTGPLANAATAQNHPAFTRMVQSLGKFYASAGLCLGTVTLYDLPDWARTKYAMPNADDDTVCGDLSQMFTLAAPGNQINFFLVSGFTNASQQGLNVVGIDGTIPGPSSVGGTVNSGASVNGSNLGFGTCTSQLDIHNCGPDEVAYIAAHEGGHFMGLYHTTEQTGDSFDPLSDTPTCRCDTCAPAAQQANCASKNPSTSQPTLIRNESCLNAASTPVCGGGDNLMFWLLPGSFDPNPQSVFSVHQGQTIRSNLVVR